MPDLPPQVTTPLLTMITQQSLDEDYKVAAERRSLGASDPRGPTSRKVVVLVVAVFGVLVSTAFVQNTLSEDVDNAGRRALTERITAQRDRVDDLQADIAELRETNADLGDMLAAADEAEQEVENQLRRLQVGTGFVAVRGPGVRIIVDNPPNADEVLRDDDLHLLVNGLWGAGAEAIAINGQRLTAVSAIRNSGVPILVNGVGVAPPYSVLAIGDGGSLQANLTDTASGLMFAGIVDEFGFIFEMDNDGDLSLPPAPRRLQELRTAEAGTAADQSPKEEETGP
ncbi:MAG: DUF881 domain-containing protein [Actinomycetota bacterium]|nr:DUF881 domain-containing protein [Actinomycetota bacterium]